MNFFFKFVPESDRTGMQRRCAEGGADPRDVGGIEPTGLCRCQGHLGHVRLALASQKGRTAAAVVARH